MTAAPFRCCECGNSDFAEIPITTDAGREYALQCLNDDCGAVMPR